MSVTLAAANNVQAIENVLAVVCKGRVQENLPVLLYAPVVLSIPRPNIGARKTISNSNSKHEDARHTGAHLGPKRACMSIEHLES